MLRSFVATLSEYGRTCDRVTGIDFPKDGSGANPSRVTIVEILASKTRYTR